MSEQMTMSHETAPPAVHERAARTPKHVHVAQARVNHDAVLSSAHIRIAMSPSQRLTSLRKVAGYGSASEAARAMGVNPITYQHHENGTRPVSRLAVATYAVFYKAPAGYILFGESLQTTGMARIVGYIGPGGLIETTALGDSNMDVPLPDIPAAGLVALEVVAHDLAPAFRPGDLAYYEAQDLILPVDLAYLNGHDCVVVGADGRQRLRFVTSQANGRVTLLSQPGTPPEHNVELVSGARVRWIKRYDG